jgi:hypothetical protein
VTGGVVGKTFSMRTSLLGVLCVLVHACAESPAVPAANPPPVAVTPEPPVASAVVASTGSQEASPDSPPAPALSKVAAVPNWTHNGSDPATGAMTLRCENAFPPEDAPEKCLCEGYELNVCVAGIRQLVIDRKQCMFVCEPASQNAKQIALRCPDGSLPAASSKGCECSGRKPFDPCAGGIASATTTTAGECVVTCKKNQ